MKQTSTTEIGRNAEQLAGEFLAHKLNAKIIEQNWRRPGLEVDLIMLSKAKPWKLHKQLPKLYIVEVKFRKNDSRGSGLEAINRAKIQRMIRAYELWSLENNFASEIRLIGAEVNKFGHVNFCEIEVDG